MWLRVHAWDWGPTGCPQNEAPWRLACGKSEASASQGGANSRKHNTGGARHTRGAACCLRCQLMPLPPPPHAPRARRNVNQANQAPPLAPPPLPLEQLSFQLSALLPLLLHPPPPLPWCQRAPPH